MKPTPSQAGYRTDPTNAPRSVRTIRTLGHGRAARAQLVEAVMPDGRRLTCVEKVFAPGLLTRTIYRLSFQNPFAYQSNQSAILACFYRRRVAAAVLAASDTGVNIAAPIYVRYDDSERAWVLAAEWIDGRGIRPAPADASRIRRRLTRRADEPQMETEQEINTLVDTMHRLESLFSQCGLGGSGWQVAPRALVSTANLLREQDRYTIIDLESGIPAVLVPKYLVAGARRGELPPFDDLDATTLRNWVNDNERLLLFRNGVDGLDDLRTDVEKLIEHTTTWKESELAVLRRPWRLLRRDGMAPYQAECIRRWEQDKTIDQATATELPSRIGLARMIWYAGLAPGSLGRTASRLLGDHVYRSRVGRCLRSPTYRKAQFNKAIRKREAVWIEAERLPPKTRLTPTTFVMNRLLKAVTPRGLHRFIVDSQQRRENYLQWTLLALSPRYQSWFGQSRIESSINSWVRAKRITPDEAASLRRQLSGSEVRAYTRGLGAHLALKTLTPVVAPAKFGGIAAFIASGNPWFLLPLLLMPAARTAVTLASWWSTRHQHIPHGEALLAGMLPTVGSLAFPLQMYAARSDLSTFLIRDAASKLGQHVPVYGGPNSRTEIAMIRATDTLIELLELVSNTTQQLRRSEANANATGEPKIVMIPRRTRWGRTIDLLAAASIADAQRDLANRVEAMQDDAIPDKMAGETNSAHKKAA